MNPAVLIQQGMTRQAALAGMAGGEGALTAAEAAGVAPGGLGGGRGHGAREAALLAALKAMENLMTNRYADHRVSDQAGDEWHATQASLSAGRASISDADLWCTADSLGYCGAAAGPLALAWAHAAVLKGYAPAGFMLCHQSGLTGQHAAVLLRT